MPLTNTAFLDGRRLTTGPLHEVAAAVLRAQQAQPEGHPLVFSNASGQSADPDLRGGEEAFAARYTVAVSTLAGNLAGFEEASRSLFAGDREGLVVQMAAWPEDVRAYALQLAEPAPG